VRLACEHPDAPYGVTTCLHLVKRGERWVTYIRWLTGTGLDIQLLCPACAAEREAGHDIESAAVCDACRDWLVDEVGEVRGVRGRAEIRERPESIGLAIDELPIHQALGQVLDLAPITRKSFTWLLLGVDGRLMKVDFGTLAWTDLGRIDLPTEPDHDPWMDHALTPRLYVSPTEDFIAVVNDYGRKGAVYRVGEREPAMLLDSGGGHENTVPFSFAFVEHRGRCVAIHRTAWNRLDASDPSTGSLLTDRGPTFFREGEEMPAHYLDYFHGRLVVSPDGHRIVDDGWVWHPVGIVFIWDVNVWLDSNRWECEDGQTKVGLAARDYYWDHGMCWVGSERVALSGIGDDDELMIDGARIFAVKDVVDSEPRYRGRHARELTVFAGPAGQFFSDGYRLFSSELSGLSIWDPSDGARIGRIEGFRPTHQHPSGELIEVRGSNLHRWAY
jgi:hypothetical protein